MLHSPFSTKTDLLPFFYQNEKEQKVFLQQPAINWRICENKALEQKLFSFAYTSSDSDLLVPRLPRARVTT